jgi:hypothetical protein
MIRQTGLPFKIEETEDLIDLQAAPSLCGEFTFWSGLGLPLTMTLKPLSARTARFMRVA